MNQNGCVRKEEEKKEMKIKYYSVVKKYIYGC